MLDDSGPWAEIREAMSCTGFPAAAFRRLLESGDFNVRWPLTFAAWRWFATGVRVDQECAEFLTEGNLWEQTWAALIEYDGAYTDLPWVSAWRAGFEQSSLSHVRERGTNLERHALQRGGVTLGVVTRGPWDRNQGSWREWGWFEALEGSQAAVQLLEEEDDLFHEASRLERERADPVPVLAQADRVQADFMGPGVALVSLPDGGRWVLQEFHLNQGRVYWS
jgi:hypothetical protein